MSEVTPEHLQYLFCAVCMETQDLKSDPPALAITIVHGHAVCEEHRRRVDGYNGAVRAARKFLERGPSSAPYNRR